MKVKVDQLVSCVLTVVCPYMLWLSVLFLYLGTLMINSQVDDEPPHYMLPRMLFMLAVAILVLRRGGRPSCLRTANSVFFETMLAICTCNVALKLVWEQIEKIAFIILTGIAYGVEKVYGMAIACEKCKGVHDLQFCLTMLLSSLLVAWVLYSVVTIPFICKNACQGMLYKDSSVRFLSRVAVRFVNPKNYFSESPTLAPIVAPKGGHRNPVVSSPGLILMDLKHIDSED